MNVLYSRIELTVVRFCTTLTIEAFFSLYCALILNYQINGVYLYCTERLMQWNLSLTEPGLSGNLSLTNKFYGPENIPQKSI
jgi:hypothetical protein